MLKTVGPTATCCSFQIALTKCNSTQNIWTAIWGWVTHIYSPHNGMLYFDDIRYWLNLTNYTFVQQLQPRRQMYVSFPWDKQVTGEVSSHNMIRAAPSAQPVPPDQNNKHTYTCQISSCGSTVSASVPNFPHVCLKHLTANKGFSYFSLTRTNHSCSVTWEYDETTSLCLGWAPDVTYCIWGARNLGVNRHNSFSQRRTRLISQFRVILIKQVIYQCLNFVVGIIFCMLVARPAVPAGMRSICQR